MPFDWRFRNFKRDPQPFLNGAVIDAENARNNLVQNAGNDMEGYTPLESTLAAQAMEGYKPVVPATQSQLAAGASQAMQGYVPNSAGRPSVPNDMHGGMGQPDLEGYGESLQAASDAAAQEQAKEQQIADIESQIATLEKRIAENQAKLKNWNGGDVANKVAALEARKFFSQDPTSIWRWKQDKDYATQLAAKQNGTDNTAKANAMIEIANDLDSIIVDDKMTSQDQKAYLSKLSNMKTLGEKTGVPKSVIDSINAKIKEVKGENKTGSENQSQSEYKKGTDVENADKAADELLAKPDLTQGDIAKFKRNNPKVSDDKLLELNKKHNELIDRDKKRVEADKKEAELLKKGKNLTSKDIEFLKGRKGLKYHTDDYGNEWFTRG